MAPGRVIVLRSLDMHSAWLSPAALALCGLPDHPTGLLREHEAWQALARLPPHDEAADDLAVEDAVAAAHRRVRGLVAAGAAVVLGSDAPVSPLDPWHGIAAAVHRRDGSRPAWRPREAVPLEVPVHGSFVAGRCVHGPAVRDVG